MRLQQRLAYHAPATAIAVNMHLYWTGVAADLLRFGDDRMAWILQEAADGHVFAAGHGEAGNDAGLFASTAVAERVDGGWKITGRKVFGSLSPVWTYLGVHAMDVSDPAHPQVVHAFLPRDTPGYHIEPTWDALGMRATASHDTVLDGVFVPDELTPVVTPAGFAGAELFHLAILAWALLGFANVYTGVARRAYDLTVAQVDLAAHHRAHPHDGAPPRGAARGGRHAHVARGHRRLPRADLRRLVARRSTTAPTGASRSWRPSTSP